MRSHLFNRRNVIKGVTAGTVLGTLGATTATASEEPSLSHNARYVRTRNFQEVSLVMSVQSDNVSLDASANRVLRIEDPQGQSVDVIPQSDEPIELSSSFELRIYDADGEISGEPLITSGEDIPVDVAGDTSMFVDNPIFTGYTVSLVEEDQTITSTEEHVYGIGHPRDAFSQDSTTGEIEVTYEKPDLIDESWTLILSLTDYVSNDGSVIQSFNSEFEYDSESETFVTTFNGDQVQPLPDNGFRDIDVDFYNQTVDSGFPDVDLSLWGTTDLTIDPGSDVGSVEGTVTDTNDDPLESIGIDIIDPDTDETEMTMPTDENGEYAIDLLTGSYEISVEEFDFMPFNTDVTVETAETSTVDIELIAEHSSGVSQELFDAVDQDGDGELTRNDVRNMINGYAQDGEVNGVAIDRSDVRNLINFYAQQ